MLIYREDSRRVNTREELARLRLAVSAAGHTCPPAAALSLLIDAGEFESAIVDELATRADDLHPLAAAAGAVSRAAARAWLDAERDGATALSCLQLALDRLPPQALPPKISLRVSEGYAYYALFPHAYAAAARRFVSDLQPRSMVVIGIRGIGASLAAVIAASAAERGCAAWSCSVRPRGHPFCRRLDVAAELQQEWRRHACAGAFFAIADEGPGLSGSSFASAVRALEDAGVPSDRIVLFPSWDPDPSRLSSLDARRIWPVHRRYWIDAAAVGITPERVFGVACATRTYSAGAWRGDLCGDAARWPPVHPHHERWKSFVPQERTVLKFAGLGRYGERSAARARQLFELGQGPRPGALRAGFLELRFVDGTPVDGNVGPDEASVIGRYIGRVAAAFRRDPSESVAALAPMIETNVAELLDATFDVPEQPDGPAADLDARMLRHEWLRTPVGLVKTDASDHHDDHFYPGPHDPAWDLAGASIELELDPAASASLLCAYANASGDRTAARRLAFYRIAYAAFRAGYVASAAAALADSPEGARFSRARKYYVDALRLALTPNAP